MNDWINTLRQLRQGGDEGVMVTVAGVRGSAPREVGAKMLVTPKETIGSIGGGQLEYRCARMAFELLQDSSPAPASFRRFPLGTTMGQCCGGVVDVLIEPVRSWTAEFMFEILRLHDDRVPFVVATGESGKSLITASDEMPGAVLAPEVVAKARRMIAEHQLASVALLDAGQRILLEPVLHAGLDVAVFGAGHVGAAVIRTLGGISCHIRWIDSRRRIFPQPVASNVTTIESPQPANEVAAMPAGAFYLVMTHSHPLDYEICSHILARDDFAYCGLIGSRTKRRRFEKLMRQQGMPQSRLDKLTCPIGVAGIDGKKPQEIAIAVAAQLLLLRDADSRSASPGHDMRVIRNS